MRQKKSTVSKVSFCIVLLTAVCSGAVTLYPVLADTAIVSFEPLRLGNGFGGRGSCIFYCDWQEKMIHKDSVVWTIDGKKPDSQAVSVSGSTNLKDVPPEFSTGSLLEFAQAAISKYGAGVHTVQIVARFPDSMVRATWHFRFFETQYKEFRAQVIIDSSWNTHESEWMNFTRYKVLSAQPLDTLIFGNAWQPQDTSLKWSMVSSDTVGIMREYLAKKAGAATIVPKDTIDCMVFQILRGASDLNQWLSPVPIKRFLKQTNPPFPISEALRFFSLFAVKNALEKRANSPKGDYRLGPIYSPAAGDPGWSLTASHDTSAWYLAYSLGYGDCPCGCTEWVTRIYKVERNGTVTNTASAIKPGNRLAATRFTHKNGAESCYNVKGQRFAAPIKASLKAGGIRIVSTKETSLKKKMVSFSR